MIIPMIAYSFPINCPSLSAIRSSDFIPNTRPNIHDRLQEKEAIKKGLFMVKKSLNDTIHIAPEEKGPSIPNAIEMIASLEIFGFWICEPAPVSIMVSSFTIRFFLTRVGRPNAIVTTE